MAKSKHTRKKTKRVRQWAVWLMPRGHYVLDDSGAVYLYRTKSDAEVVAEIHEEEDGPCRVDRVELRKI